MHRPAFGHTAVTGKTDAIRRILVAVDVSPASLAALEAAAHVAATLDAELSGLYVEDESLLRGAELPSARVVGSYSGVVRPFERRDIEHQLKSRARRAQQALQSVANRARVRWSFRVNRGAVTAVLGAASSDADMISLGRSGWTPGIGRLGRTTATILASTGAPVLLLDRGLQPGRAVVAVYDGGPGSGTALSLASMLTRGGQTPLVVVLRGDESRLEELETRASDELQKLGREGSAQFFRLGNSEAGRLMQLRDAGGIGILVLPQLRALGRPAPDLLTELRCPILIVREPIDSHTP